MKAVGAKSSAAETTKAEAARVEVRQPPPEPAPAEGAVAEQVLLGDETRATSIIGADGVSVYDYFVESLLSEEPPSLGLASASTFFASFVCILLLCVLVLISHSSLLCGDGGMSLVAKPHIEPPKAVVGAIKDLWAKFFPVVERGGGPKGCCVECGHWQGRCDTMKGYGRRTSSC